MTLMRAAHWPQMSSERISVLRAQQICGAHGRPVGSRACDAPTYNAASEALSGRMHCVTSCFVCSWTRSLCACAVAVCLAYAPRWAETIRCCWTTVVWRTWQPQELQLHAHQFF